MLQTSLRAAIVAALALGLLVPTGALLLYEGNQNRRIAMQELDRDLQRISEVLALSLSEPIWQVSPELAEPMNKAQVSDPRFVSVRILEPGAAKPFLEFSRPAEQANLVLRRVRPVLRDGREIAQLSVEMTAAPQIAQRQADMVRSLWRAGLTLTLSAMLILLVLQRRVLRPMDKLSQAAARLAGGQFDVPLAMPGDDEIARVGVAMERMRLALLKAFEDLRQHANTLESQVADRTAELTAANAELKQALLTLKTAQRELVESEKLASLGRLVAGVAHELNTPLGNALTVVSALEDRWAELDELLGSGAPMRRSVLVDLVKDTRRGQDILQRNVAKAADLVRDFKQVAIDQTSDTRRDFELSRVVDDVLTMVEPSFKHTPYKVETELQTGLSMNSYPGALGQVLTNLLMNALVHGFEGRDHGCVRVRCRAIDAAQVELSVSDDGKGMNEDVRRRIFDPFFTTRLGTGGSGLGMHIVHNIVTKVLGGQIEVFSAPDHGTTMTVRLPRTAPASDGTD